MSIRFDQLKITLLDCSLNQCLAWQNALIFVDECEYLQNVTVENSTLEEFMKTSAGEAVEGIVCPANSFGLMDGGFDGAITRFAETYYNKSIIPYVQNHIIKQFDGEQPVGTSTIIDVPGFYYRLIHTPTMRRPMPIVDSEVVYQCTRSCILAAMSNEIFNIVIPAFGGATGQVPAYDIAKLMVRAMLTFVNHPSEYNWNYIYKKHPLEDINC